MVKQQNGNKFMAPVASSLVRSIISGKSTVGIRGFQLLICTVGLPWLAKLHCKAETVKYSCICELHNVTKNLNRN